MRFFAAIAALTMLMAPLASGFNPDQNPLELPKPGDSWLRILSPDHLELTLITNGGSGVFSSRLWDFAGDPPDPDRFEVRAGGEKIPVERVGFRRRPVYAPLKKDDLRVGNYLVLRLARPIPEGADVVVTNPDGKLWKADRKFAAVQRPGRQSPAVHVSQAGYAPALPKKAYVGYFLGDLGELPVSRESGFRLVDLTTGQAVYEGPLKLSPDSGFSFHCYGKVFEADFTDFKTPGRYTLVVPGLGRSFPFHINDGVPALLTRLYALGFYTQRCGSSNLHPYTRFTHGRCHMGPVEVPTPKFQAVETILRDNSTEFEKNPDHTAPLLSGVNQSLYPFVRQGKIDVVGGHHDAGDYSRYTINSAQLIHHLVFAVDAFPGVAELDNLGIPESADGKSDILQIAKWEADFLARLQDDDGGFYFLVFPRDRPFEDNVLPDGGDPQVVYPKTTAATAAATAALAQAGSSPHFKKQFPKEAALYLKKAKKGWEFLEKAWAKFGRQAAYQKITHYGDYHQDHDEIVWAAAELYVATGDPRYHKLLLAEFDPTDRDTWRWTWWSLFEAYGCAARAYAFGHRTGRVSQDQLDPALLGKCEAQIWSRARECATDAQNSAYGTSFPEESKGHRTAGFYFPNDMAFDITVGYQIDPRPEFVTAVVGNWNYEAGCNPLNVSFLTGLGSKRPREMVHQYAQNDARILPPSGLPIGSVQQGFGWIGHYEKELGLLTYPSDGDRDAPYPMYDRWGDSFNIPTEFTVINLSRSLASLAYWMARSPLKDQPWKSASSKIVDAGGMYGLRVENVVPPESGNLDPQKAQVLWESVGSPDAPEIGVIFQPRGEPKRIEVEAIWPDGRRTTTKR